MRLSAALLQTTFAQTQLSVDADLVLMQEWAAKFHVHASQQADHGCSLLSSSMCVFCLWSWWAWFALPQQQIREREKGSGGTDGGTSLWCLLQTTQFGPWRDCFKTSSIGTLNVSWLRCLSFNSLNRLTIMVIDCTLWPQRVLAASVWKLVFLVLLVCGCEVRFRWTKVSACAKLFAGATPTAWGSSWCLQLIHQRPTQRFSRIGVSLRTRHWRYLKALGPY